MKDFHLSGIQIEAKSTRRISYTQGWQSKNVAIKTSDNSKIDVRNSTDMKNIRIKKGRI